MNKTLCLVCCLLLSACGGSNEPLWLTTNHGYGYHYDETTERGLRLRHEPGADKVYGIHQYEQWYEYVEQCTGLTASPPLIIVVADFIPSLTHEYPLTDGQYWRETETIIIYGDSPWHPVSRIASHEYIHHLMSKNNFAPDVNHNHRWFNDCVIF